MKTDNTKTMYDVVLDKVGEENKKYDMAWARQKPCVEVSTNDIGLVNENNRDEAYRFDRGGLIVGKDFIFNVSVTGHGTRFGRSYIFFLEDLHQRDYHETMAEVSQRENTLFSQKTLKEFCDDFEKGWSK